jgi:hypothetical protein
MNAGEGHRSPIHFPQPHSNERDLSVVPIPAEEITRHKAI